MKCVGYQTQLGHFVIGDFPSGFVSGGIEGGSDLEPLVNTGMGNEINNCRTTDEGASPPVLGDEGEHAVFDLVPLARTGRKVTNMDGHSERIRELLELNLPKAGTVAITAPTVSRDEEFPRVRIARSPHLFPPASDGRSRKGGGIMRDPDTDPPFVCCQIIDAIGNHFPELRISEIMEVHLFGLSFRSPLLPWILEMPNQFFLFGIYRDHWLMASLKGLDGFVDVPKLGVSIRMSRTLSCFPIRLETVSLFVEEDTDGPLTHAVPLAGQLLRQVGGTLARPPKWRFRITAGGGFDEVIQGGQQGAIRFGEFLSPPPG